MAKKRHKRAIEQDDGHLCQIDKLSAAVWTCLMNWFGLQL